MAEDYVPVFDNPYPADYAGQEIVKFEYLTPLRLYREIESVKNRRGEEDAEYLVENDYIVNVWLAGAAAPHTIRVPRGMLTDLSSVPWWGRWLVDRVGPHLEASIVHDFLYIAWIDARDHPQTARRQDRDFADAVFMAGMIDAEVGRARRNVIHAAVRLAGWGYFADKGKTPRYRRFW